MSIVTPLGDSQYFDLGHTVLNGFGVEIRIHEDIWGGDIHNHIPDPPLTLAWPESWGQADFPLQSVLLEPGQDSYQMAESPEPGMFDLVFVCLVAIIIARLYRHRTAQVLGGYDGPQMPQ